MYEAFFGLVSRPFDLTPDPRYLFLTPSHREALSSLEYGISARTGVTVLVGEAGTGKTTLIRATLDARDQAKTKTIYMNNPTLTRSEFLEFLAAEFQLPTQTAESKTRLLRELEDVLIGMLHADITPALIIDEAQSLPHELLEEIRLLANIETPREKLLPIILAGQPELAMRLNHQSLRQLKQRVGLRCDLRPLDLGRNRVLYHGARQSRGRHRGSLVHARSRDDDSRAIARHSACHQRHLPQRAHQRVRARAETGDNGMRARSVPRFRVGQDCVGRSERRAPVRHGADGRTTRGAAITECGRGVAANPAARNSC